MDGLCARALQGRHRDDSDTAPLIGAKRPHTQPPCTNNFAVLVNQDVPHRWFRQWGMTRETAYLTDWYTMFATWENRLVVLNLRNVRRIYGWPKQWPGPEDARLFVIEDPKWLGDGAPVPAGEALAVQADDVEMVEFVSILPASSSPKDAEDAQTGKLSTETRDQRAAGAAWEIHQSATETAQ